MRTCLTLAVSGNLGYNTLVYLFEFTDIELIATDKNSFDIIDFAKAKSIPLFIGNPRNGKLSLKIKNDNNTLFLSINYLFLLEEDLILKFIYPINFHGSLLPKYRGRTPHVWSIINNEIETGITAHIIDSGCDTGDILLQTKIPISENDTGFSLLEKYNEIYPLMINELIDQIKSKNINRTKQDASVSTVYGQRTPLDGRINWGWQKVRIRNWVRAQTYPYPGAFTFFDNKKIIIDKVSFCEIGFNNDLKNGTILQVKPTLVVKTSNGAVKIDVIRNNDAEFIQNKILS